MEIKIILKKLFKMELENHDKKACLLHVSRCCLECELWLPSTFDHRHLEWLIIVCPEA